MPEVPITHAQFEGIESYVNSQELLGECFPILRIYSRGVLVFKLHDEPLILRDNFNNENDSHNYNLVTSDKLLAKLHFEGLIDGYQTKVMEMVDLAEMAAMVESL
jgi:hypothetical protein